MINESNDCHQNQVPLEHVRHVSIAKFLDWTSKKSTNSNCNHLMRVYDCDVV